MFFLSLFTVYLSPSPFYEILEQLNVNKMAEMNYREPKDRLGNSKLNHVFLKIYPYDPTSKCQG